MNKKEVIFKICREINKETAKKVATIQLKKQKLNLTDSKLGGIPYLPVDGEFPVDSDGRQLTLLAQINCEDLQGMNDFPHKGLLQFFILMDNCYAYDDDNTEQNKFRVIYYDEIDKNVKEEFLVEKYKPYLEEEYLLPFEGEFKINFEISEEGMSFEDCKFDGYFVKKYNELFPQNEIKSFYELDDEEEDVFDILDELSEEVSGQGNKVGGYPYFTQSDPREFEDCNAYDTLLLQIDTTDDDDEGVHIMWGDSGVCNFFINSDRLKNLDFSDVLYNWDCC